MGNAKPKPLRRKGPSPAPGQYLGFTTQSTRFLVRLLEAQQGDTVCLEVFADVGVEKPDGAKIAEESKSNLATNPLTDRSLSLSGSRSGTGWRQSQMVPSSPRQPTSIYSLTTATPGIIAQSFHDAASIDDAEGFRRKPRPISNGPGPTCPNMRKTFDRTSKSCLRAPPRHGRRSMDRSIPDRRWAMRTTGFDP